MKKIFINNLKALIMKRVYFFVLSLFVCFTCCMKDNTINKDEDEFSKWYNEKTILGKWELFFFRRSELGGELLGKIQKNLTDMKTITIDRMTKHTL